MLSSVVVKVGIYGMIRLTTLVFIPNADLLRSWLIGLGLVSIFFGSLSALRTHNGKRMLAYSTFGQIGFILLGIGWGTPLALAAAIIYTFNHAFIKSALLMLMGVIASHTKTKTARLSEIQGLGALLPSFLGLLYLLGGMALAGLPPMNGFISKYVLVRGGIDAESWWALGLAVAAGALTLMYMIRTWQDIFQQAPTDETAETKGYGDSFLAPALLIATCLLLGVYASPLFDVAERAADELNNPGVYIDAVGLFDNQEIEVGEW
jgi:multicomponent Na+:H+ antiporter subunit D